MLCGGLLTLVQSSCYAKCVAYERYRSRFSTALRGEMAAGGVGEQERPEVLLTRVIASIPWTIESDGVSSVSPEGVGCGRYR